MADSIYWINNDYVDYSIRRAPLDGSGPIDTLYGRPCQRGREQGADERPVTVS